MTLPQRVGQLFMVGTPASGADAGVVANQISQYHLGNVFLSGRSGSGVTSTAAVVAGFRARVSSATTAGVPLLVGTDQEGGNVQVLSGPGFASIPTALSQGSWSSATEIANSAEWGRELHAAGVNLDLAPVTDTVPSAAFAPSNLPIGYWQREYGYDPATVAAHSVAFTKGMSSSGVGTAIKHFPGLGYVTGNTDDTVHVVGFRHDQVRAGRRCFRHRDPLGCAGRDGVVRDLQQDRSGQPGVLLADGDARHAARRRGIRRRDHDRQHGSGGRVALPGR